MPWDKTEWAQSGEQGVDAPGGCLVAYNRSAAPHPPSALTAWTTRGVSRATLPTRRCGEEGCGISWRRQRASLPPPRRIAWVAAARDKNSETDALSQGTDALGYSIAAAEELDCYTVDVEDNGDDSLSQKQELRNQGWREDE